MCAVGICVPNCQSPDKEAPWNLEELSQDEGRNSRKNPAPFPSLKTFSNETFFSQIYLDGQYLKTKEVPHWLLRYSKALKCFILVTCWLVVAVALCSNLLVFCAVYCWRNMFSCINLLACCLLWTSVLKICCCSVQCTAGETCSPASTCWLVACCGPLF